MIQSRKRLGVAAGTAAMTLAGVFAFPSAANADAVHPDAVRDLVVTGGENELTVDWRRADTGEPATSYVVLLFNDKGVQIGGSNIVHEPNTSITLDKLAAGKYFVEVYSHNAYPGFGGPVISDLVTVINAEIVTPPPAIDNHLPYRPYKNWADLIDQEYRMWTGCSADTKAVAGRFPRDDEFTYWLDWLTDEPFSDSWNQVDWDRWDRFYDEWAYEIWGDLSNDVIQPGFFNAPYNDFIGGPAFTPEQVAAFKASAIYAELYADNYATQTTIPSTGGFAPADDPVNGGNGNNLIDGAEGTWAAIQADNFARYEPHIYDAFYGDVSDQVWDWALNDVYFARRVDFVRQLAENAEQLEGPAYRLYTAYFSRIPDAGGLCFWGDALRSGWSLLDVSEFFVTSQEFLDTYGEYETYGTEEKTDAAEFVSLVYRNVLDREPDATGESFWVRQLQTERYSPAEMLIGFSESQEFKNRMSSKVGTGLMYLHELGRMPTQAEYVEGDLFWQFFQTNPDEQESSLHNEPWFGMMDYWGFSAPNSALYWWMVDTDGEYLARTQITIPSHLHPHEYPGSLNHEAN